MNHFIFEISVSYEQEIVQKYKRRTEKSKRDKVQCLGIIKEDDNVLHYGNELLENMEDSLCVIGDIKIYNRNFLLERLSPGKHMQEPCTDHQLLCKSYKKWGTGCLQHITGDFSFVLWDKLEKSLFAARDHIGVKQLYYRNTPGQSVAISSSTRLLIEGEIAWADQINTQYLTDYLLGLLPDSSATVFDSILQLPPAQFLTFDGTEVVIKKYWSPKISYLSSPFKKDHHKKQFLKVFQTILEERWSGGKKSALLLSGGLDSTSILCMLCEKLKVDKEEIQLISWVASDSEINEIDSDAKFIEIALDYTGVKTSYCTESKTPIGVTDLFNYYDSGFRLPWSPLIVNINPLEQHYKNRGITTIFNGFGGDEIVSIDPQYKELWLFFGGKFLLLYKIFKKEQHKTGKSVLKSIFGKIIFPLLPKKIQLAYKNLRGNTQFDVIENSFINYKLSSRSQLKKYAKKNRGWWNSKGYYDPRKEIKEAVSAGYFIPFLEHCSAISERSACELNMPLIDRRIIEFCLSVPAGEYVRDGVARSFIRNCMKGILPEEIRNRESKTLFGDTIDIQMASNRELFDAILDTESTLAWQIIDRDHLRKSYEALLAGMIKTQHRPIIGHQISKGINVAAFCQWFEAKREVS